MTVIDTNTAATQRPRDRSGWADARADGGLGVQPDAAALADPRPIWQ
ncbi:hypothetical protein [Plantactinospora soyae]|uniref:Uncharacterized protein n=1 Tax=Plantactinospora soyae TaxID=1544732 RepID=A0A927MG32_9ACTN|nr:hypothetical protein [Plantactinospora soyae]MBE1491048.1 hypothetical protein [Plantactinospora soyae]